MNSKFCIVPQLYHFSVCYEDVHKLRIGLHFKWGRKMLDLLGVGQKSYAIIFRKFFLRTSDQGIFYILVNESMEC